MFTRTETLGLLLLFHYYNFIFSSPCLPFKLISGGSAGKESLCNVGDLGLIPGLGRSPGEGSSYPLQYSDLENSMDYIVHGVAKSWDTTERLSLPFTFKVSLIKNVPPGGLPW